MKNWKYIHVGNDATAEKLGLKPAPFDPNQLKSEDEKKVKELFQKNGGDYEKTIKDIKAEYKSLPEDGIRRMLYNLVGVPQKAKNESIYKQEASMFGGLGKKAEKEIGNASESQDIRNEYNAEIHRLEKKMEELYRRGQGHSAMQVQKQIEQLQKELRELGNKKTGNSWVAVKKKNGTYMPVEEGFYYRINGKRVGVEKIEGKTLKLTDGTTIRVDSIQDIDVGNETKGERKFGKVMGEFEEGALKTPQGKTVTDPAQAKAIAYSEADKVDNLKRARKAIKNKK